jgi:hypothetical protein
VRPTIEQFGRVVYGDGEGVFPAAGRHAAENCFGGGGLRDCVCVRARRISWPRGVPLPTARAPCEQPPLCGLAAELSGDKPTAGLRHGLPREGGATCWMDVDDSGKASLPTCDDHARRPLLLCPVSTEGAVSVGEFHRGSGFGWGI